MNHSRSLKFTVISLSAALLPLFVQADESDWLYFPMYQRDTAHAVHLSALKRRPDGLLESATRYPRVRDEQWTKEESDAGWYDYQKRLIDCETGLSIVSTEHLLDQEGRISATHDNTIANLAQWKNELPNKTQQPTWPILNEIFLSCAVTGDAGFLAQRRQVHKKKMDILSYSPRVRALKAETQELFWSKARFRPDIGALIKRPPGDARQLFDELQKQHRTWLSGFAPELAGTPKAKSGGPSAGLDEMHLGWLRLQQVDIVNVSSRADGVVRYTDQQPAYQDIPDEYHDFPPNLPDVKNVALEFLLDCRSGQQVATRQTWLNRQLVALASRPIGVKPLLRHLQQQSANDNESSTTNILLPPSNNSSVRAICLAVAAQCQGRAAAELESFRLSTQDEDAIQQAGSPAVALLAARQAFHDYQRNFIPDCVLGQPF